MAAHKKDVRRLELKVDAKIFAVLEGRAKSLGFPSTQALALEYLAEKAKENKEPTVGLTARESDIDLRSLLIEAHKSNAEANRTIAEQARTIAAMAQEQKNAPIAEPVIVAGPPSPSTQRQQILKLLGEMEASEAQLMISDLKITVPAMRSRSRSATL